MSEFPLKIETTEDGIEVSRECPSPEWSITGKGGRTDTVVISDADLPAVFEAMRRRMNEIHERNSI